MYEEENFIILYIQAHGNDGTVDKSTHLDSRDPSMIAEPEMNMYIRSKLNHLKTKTLNEEELKNIDELLEFEDFLSINQVNQNKIQKQMCNLFISEAVAVSGVCSISNPKKNSSREESETEQGMHTIYNNYYYNIKSLGLSNISKFKKLLTDFKEFYSESHLKTTTSISSQDVKISMDQNKLLQQIDGLFRIFCPTVFKRNKSFKFGPEIDNEITKYNKDGEIVFEGTHFCEHYGLHIVDMFHKDLEEIPPEEIPPELGPINYPIVPNPFPLGAYASRNIESHADPYNINYLDNQKTFKIILWIRKKKRDISDEQYVIAMTILQNLLIEIRNGSLIIQTRKLHNIWILLDILGFKNVYCIDMSCRELNKAVSSSKLKSGKSYGAYGDELVPIFSHDDPYSWEICSEDPGDRATRSQTEKKEKIMTSHFGKKKEIGGRKTRKNKYKKNKTRNKNNKTRNKKTRNKNNKTKRNYN